jgi:hypothetical protein
LVCPALVKYSLVTTLPDAALVFTVVETPMSPAAKTKVAKNNKAIIGFMARDAV